MGIRLSFPWVPAGTSGPWDQTTPLGPQLPLAIEECAKGARLASQESLPSVCLAPRAKLSLGLGCLDEAPASCESGAWRQGDPDTLLRGPRDAMGLVLLSEAHPVLLELSAFSRVPPKDCLGKAAETEGGEGPVASEGPQTLGAVTSTWRGQNQQLASVETEAGGVNILQRPKALVKMSRTCPGSGGTSQVPGTVLRVSAQHSPAGRRCPSDST